jgi:hypothetical protein
MRMSQWTSLLQALQFIGYALLVAALPLSNLLMSVALFWLAGVWLLQVITDRIQQKKLSVRFDRFKQNKNAWLLCLLYFLPVIGLLWTEDFRYAAWDLRMKLPILILPFILTTLNPLTETEYRRILGTFLLSLTFCVIWCLLIYWHIHPKQYQDVREISVFISHVRFSLLIILGLAIVFFEAWHLPFGKPLSIMLSALFLYFLYVIASMTGYLVLGCIILWAIARKIKTSEKKSLRIGLTSLLLLIPAVSILLVQQSYKKYFDVSNVDWNNLEKTSSHGEVYDHTPQYKAVEDGHYVMTHIAWGELYEGWSERSNRYPDSLDNRGHVLKGTLIRYLASKNLKKDLDGIRALSDEDVALIEQGIPLYNENNKSGLRKRLDNIFFELANYRAGGSPNGHSVFQRFEFWRTALIVIHENLWTGVGTGDVKKTFEATYQKINSPLDSEHRLRAHNQYLTMWITYGVFGFIFFITMIFYPLWKNRGNALFVSFSIIAAMSFLTEDTLESQAGVMFFSFFYLFFTLKKKITLSTLRPAKSRV